MLPPLKSGLRTTTVVSRGLHRALLASLNHDCLNVAQAAAYSAMVSLFPGLIVAAAIVTLLPDTAPLRFQAAVFFDRILPPDVSPLLETYFQSSHHNPQSLRALLAAAMVSLLGASSVLATLMEGFRRAHGQPEVWKFWKVRRRALMLVPLSLLPLTVVSLLVVFGHFVSVWMALHFAGEARATFYVAALLVRWAVALGGSVVIIAVIYHLGTPGCTHWHRTFPGAVVATAAWFLATLGFGWYVTRFANYTQVYGSLGVGIALLFWLYLILLCVLYGAEFNAQLFPNPVCALPPADSTAKSPPSRVESQG